MDAEKLFEDLKQTVITGLQHVNLSNIHEFIEWSAPHFRIMSDLTAIQTCRFVPEEKESLVDAPSIRLESTSIDTDKVSICDKEIDVKSENESVEEYPFGIDHTFLKKAYGGIIKGMNYPIAEEIVRTLSLENGNKIRITGIKGHFADNTPKYEFDVINRMTTPNPSLVEIKHGIIDCVGNRLVVTETIYGSIKDDEQHICLYINERDAARLRLKKGDIIDGRYYSNNVMNTFRVTYLYETEELAPQRKSVETKKLVHRQNNSVAPVETGMSMLERLDQTPFIGLKVLLVGLRSRVNDFAELSKKCEDVQFTHLTGDEHKMRIRAQVIKADYVLLSTVENSHDTTKYVAKLCNEHSIPFTSTSSDGFIRVLHDAKELIQQTRKTVSKSKGA